MHFVHSSLVQVILKKKLLRCSRYQLLILHQYSTKPDAKTVSYKDTIILPKTKFPSRCNPKQQVDQLKKLPNLYKWQREHLKEPEYVLHDGPPYANGDLHLGHAINKVLKDISNRSRIISGQKVHYVPGWDCHGLPIELKALDSRKKEAKPTDPVEIRNKAKMFALATAAKQKEVFESWGVMADWEQDCYFTLDKSYVRNQLRQFYAMFKKGLIYRDVKPVYWSPSSRTALAEAELEYDPEHKSTQVYVHFPLQNVPDELQLLVPGKEISALVWTTTPWTLPSNQAICFNSSLKYSLVKVNGAQENSVYIMSTALVSALEKEIGEKINVEVDIDAQILSRCSYTHPMNGKRLKFVPADHVTEAKGTGLVHTAPAHGPDDYLVAMKNRIAVESHVDESGRYVGLGPALDGLQVLAEGQSRVIESLGRHILFKSEFVHSYPLDWRTKKPVILRASNQWFIDTTTLKAAALDAVRGVDIKPATGSVGYRQGFMAQIENRPYWCISRQRVWGTPIPVVYHGDTPIVTEDLIDNLCSLIDKKGIDFWWTSGIEELVPESLLKKQGLSVDNLQKGQDILDIWLDSGLSWSAVLAGRQADVYVEGLDQFRGWFQSSLLTSVALEQRSPYKSIFVHGFIVDENGRKMSKSIGNVIDPQTVINGGKNLQKNPAYGINTLRWWVASHGTQHTQITISKKFLEDSFAEINRIRNTLKFLLGAISDMKKEDFEISQPIKLNHLDAFMLKELEQTEAQIQDYYTGFRFNSVCSTLLSFISNQVSSLYCHCIKDRLYCDLKYSENRVSCQLVLNNVLLSLSRCLGPILPHLIEEVWRNHPASNGESFFQTDTKKWRLECEEIDISAMDTIFDVKKQLNKVSPKSEQVDLVVNLRSELYDKFKSIQIEDFCVLGGLCEVFLVSSVRLVRDDGLDCDWNIDAGLTMKHQCVRCRRYSSDSDNENCVRCQVAVDEIRRLG